MSFAARGKLVDRRDDLYETPPVAVTALMRVETLPQVVWEPACGPGSIVGVLRQAGHYVYATDLVDYGCPDSESRVDFLMERHPGFYVGGIVTNPPFKLGREFVTHALTLGIPKIYMLLRLEFITSECRRTILESGQLKNIYVFAERLPPMHRDGWDGERITSSKENYAWFCWDLAYAGPTALSRISRKYDVKQINRSAGDDAQA